MSEHDLTNGEIETNRFSEDLDRLRCAIPKPFDPEESEYGTLLIGGEFKGYENCYVVVSHFSGTIEIRIVSLEFGDFIDRLTARLTGTGPPRSLEEIWNEGVLDRIHFETSDPEWKYKVRLRLAQLGLELNDSW